MNFAERIGDAFGRGLGRILDPIVGARLRAHYAGKFGKCAACSSPLAGPSPAGVCEPCRANEALAMAIGGPETGDA
jgi:hypothetical protein